MRSYANILQGITIENGEKSHYYAFQASVVGRISFKELAAFMSSPARYGQPLSAMVGEVLDLYDIGGRVGRMDIFNLSASTLEDLKTWEVIGSRCRPILGIDRGVVCRLEGKPQNISTDQVRALEIVCQEVLNLPRR